MAARRLNKIGGLLNCLTFYTFCQQEKEKHNQTIHVLCCFIDTLAKGLVDTEKIEKQITKNKNKKVLKTKSPPKRTRTRQINYVDSDDDLTNSDAEPSIMAMVNSTRRSIRRSCSIQRVQRAQRSAYDPNIIVLDCDDEFIGGPAVAFSRNIAGANTISAEDQQGLKVSVKVSNKIEQFDLNAVSDGFFFVLIFYPYIFDNL